MAVSAYQPQLSQAYMGLAADAKPTAGVAAGSRFLETDTLKLFIFLNTGSWVQIGLLAATTAPFPAL